MSDEITSLNAGMVKMVVEQMPLETNTPLLYVNHAEVRSTTEETYIVLYQRLDPSGKLVEEGGEKIYRVPAKPVGVVVMGKSHMERFAKALLANLDGEGS